MVGFPLNKIKVCRASKMRFPTDKVYRGYELTKCFFFFLKDGYETVLHFIYFSEKKLMTYGGKEQ